MIPLFFHTLRMTVLSAVRNVDPSRALEMGTRLENSSENADSPPASSSPNMQGTVNASRADYGK